MPGLFRFIGDSLKSTQTSVRRKNWPSVEGTLESYDVVGNQVLVRISYSVDGVHYPIYENLEVGPYRKSDFVERMIHQRYIERTIQINYNPKDPREALITSVEE